jgi:hypothetical protein
MKLVADTAMLVIGLTLRVGLLTMPVLALLAACGELEEPKPRPLPEDRQDLSPGTYRSEEFEPSLTFRIGQGWTNAPPEASDNLTLTWGQTWVLRFVTPRHLYKPKTGSSHVVDVVDASDDLVGWYQRHPYLRTDEPEPVRVGGLEGVRFDVIVAKDLPKDRYGLCGQDCVDIARFEHFDLIYPYPPGNHHGACGSSETAWTCSSNGALLSIRQEEKQRLIVLEDVKGKTVTIGFASLATEFEAFAPIAQKVIDSVEWKGT